MSILDEIKSAAKERGGDRAKIMYWKDGDKKRIRFLNDMEEGQKVIFHSNWEERITALCLEQVGKKCPYCGDDRCKDKKMFAWSVYDYESEDVKIVMFAGSSKCSPVLNLASMYEDYGTLTDRDYNIKREGKQLDTNYSVIPMDKKKFLGDKIKPYTKKSLFAILEKAYPCDEVEKGGNKKNDNDNEDDDDLPFKSNKGKAAVNDTDDNENDVELDYSEMSAKDLYKLCCRRGIIVEQKKPAKYYIEQLEMWDKQTDDWSDDE